MKAEIKSQHWNDPDGNPAGGNTFGNGFAIGWQNGPLGRDEERVEQNGAFVEDIITAAMDRLDYYQESRFACTHNAQAIELLSKACEVLHTRTADRESRQVEGTYRE